MNLYLKNAVGILVLVILWGLGMYLCDTVIDLDKQNRLLEIKLADQRKINDELSADNEALVEENVLWRIHSQAVCSDAMSKPPAADDESLKLQKSVYWY